MRRRKCRDIVPLQQQKGDCWLASLVNAFEYSGVKEQLHVYAKNYIETLAKKYRQKVCITRNALLRDEMFKRIMGRENVHMGMEDLEEGMSDSDKFALVRALLTTNTNDEPAGAARAARRMASGEQKKPNASGYVMGTGVPYAYQSVFDRGLTSHIRSSVLGDWFMRVDGEINRYFNSGKKDRQRPVVFEVAVDPFIAQRNPLVYKMLLQRCCPSDPDRPGHVRVLFGFLTRLGKKSVKVGHSIAVLPCDDAGGLVLCDSHDDGCKPYAAATQKMTNDGFLLWRLALYFATDGPSKDGELPALMKRSEDKMSLFSEEYQRTLRTEFGSLPRTIEKQTEFEKKLDFKLSIRISSDENKAEARLWNDAVTKGLKRLVIECHGDGGPNAKLLCGTYEVSHTDGDGVPPVYVLRDDDGVQKVRMLYSGNSWTAWSYEGMERGQVLLHNLFRVPPGRLPHEVIADNWSVKNILVRADVHRLHVVGGTKADEDLLNAARDGNVNKVERLIREGANVRANDELGWTALHWASYRGYLRVARLLIEEGASVSTPDKWGQTALHLVARDGHDKWGQTALHLAGHDGHAAVARFLIQIGRADVDAKDLDGETALMVASENGNAILVDLLIKEGADVDVKDNDGQTALMKASKDGHAAVATLLKGARKMSDGI